MHKRTVIAWTCVGIAGAIALAQVGVGRAQDDLRPTARVVFPGLSPQGAMTVPPTLRCGVEGSDPDTPAGRPARFRFLFKEAVTPDGIVINGPSRYNLYYDQLVSFEDSAWSDWMEYPVDEVDRTVSFPNLADQTYYLFAVQTLDPDGAVSVGRRYQEEVAHFFVRAGATQPAVAVNDPYLGMSTSSYREFSIAAGQPLNFSWSATAAAYNGVIVSMRFGWDIVDIDDPYDPGWAVPPGMATVAPERSFGSGLHAFHLVVGDDSGQVTHVEWRLNVVPFVDYNLQQELLVIDQVVDNLVFSWPDRSGIPRDGETYRNAFWSFLRSQPGGVNGLDWDLDRIDHREDVDYADLVAYKAVLCYARINDRQLMFRKFRPEDQVDKFVWLIPYQRWGGNLFLVGGGSMDSFLEIAPNYMTPVIFDSPEETWPDTSATATFIVGFGSKTLPDGTEVARGPLQYPYAVAGVSALDWTSVNSKYVYARPRGTMKSERHNDCVGLKALVLDTDFRSHWLIGPGAIADTIRTDPVIDWQDAMYAQNGTLDVIHNTFPFRNDEFVDENISERTTPIVRQECADVNAPGGFCVEPMFRGIARFDWVREQRQLADPDWPNSQYTPADLDEQCGVIALAAYGPFERGTARTNGRTYGFVSYKMTAEKPSAAPDVYWGFDPYRFDNDESRKAIRWVLKEVFRLDVLDP